MNPIIAEHWARKQLPGLDCIVHADDRVVILNYYGLYDPNTKTHETFCRPRCDTSIESIVRYDPDPWVEVDEWTGANVDYQGGRILGGGGGMGNEGFIARVDAEEKLVWGMFLENSNPIKSLEIREDTLIAINEHDELRITIKLDDPADIAVAVLKEYHGI